MKHSAVNKKHAELFGALQITRLFSSLSSDDVAFLATRCSLMDKPDGTAVFSPRTQATCLYIVISGSVVVRAEDDRALLAEYVAGDSFGEMEFFTGTQWSALAHCEGPCRLLAFPGDGLDLNAALGERPEIGARILRNFLRVISSRIRNANTLVKENSPWVRELKKQVYGDKLTGLYNQAWLREQLDVALREGVGLLMLKPDNFKDINDSYGHEAGDNSLVLIARALEKICSSHARIVRYMGNEMAIVLEETDRSGLVSFAKKIQKILSQLDLTPALGTDDTLQKPPHLRSSFGLALYPEHGKTIHELIASCEDLPLYARAHGGSLILFPEDRK